MNFSIGSRHYHVSVLVLLGLALGLLWLSTRGADAEPDPSPAWVAAAKHYHWTERLLVGQVAGTQGRLRHLTQDTTKLLWDLKVARAHQEALERFADSVRGRPPSVVVQKLGDACTAVLDNCDARVAVWRQQDSLHRTLYELAAPRLARADSIIAAGMKARECHWLLFKCPSRTTVAGVFFVLGAGAAGAALR